MGKHDKWHSNLPYPSKDETPIYYALYNHYVHMHKLED